MRERGERADARGSERHPRSRVGRGGLFFLLAALFGSTLGVDCAPPPAVDPADVRTIEDFVRCVNPRLSAMEEVSIADTVQCLPPKCSLTLTLSNTSAQPACIIGDCQLPRVLVTCPGPPLFMPSYSLCASDGGANRVEIGEAIDAAGNMRMADIDVEPGEFEEISETDILSENDEKGCNSNGANCHETYTPPSTMLKHSKPIDPFDGSDGSNGNPDCIVATDRCDQQAIAGPKNCYGTTAEPRMVQPQSLSDICDCIEASRADFESELAQAPHAAVVEETCHALEEYQSTRGACAVADCPPATGPECLEPLASCDPATGATVAVASGYHCSPAEDAEDAFQCVADCPCRAYDLHGGGKFLVNGAVSMVRAEIDGLVASPSSGTFEDSDAVSGTLTAFNYLTRTYVEVVTFTSIEATQGGLDFDLTGTASALVNGVPSTVSFTASQTGGDASFELHDAGTLEFLAGGTGEDDRSAFQLTVGP